MQRDINHMNKVLTIENNKIDWRIYLLRLCLILMGALVIYFNARGYDILFSDAPFLGIASPFSILLAITEISVLIWTYAVISNWPNMSKIVKCIILILVPAFSFLCFTGINSYLSMLATAEITELSKVEVTNENNEELLSTYSKEANSIENQLAQIRDERKGIIEKRAEYTMQINNLYNQASERRLTATNCDKVTDCKNSVNAFEAQAKDLTNQVNSLDKSTSRLDQKINEYENDLENASDEIKKIKLESTLNINEHAGTESNFERKKKTYENIVLKISSFFNYSPEDPFGVFIAFISFIIYPVYFILNLYLALESDENKAARAARIKSKKVKRSQREKIYLKLIKYCRVWAHGRKKTRIVKEVNIVEVEKPIEVEVEKIKEVEVIKFQEIEVEKPIEIIKEVIIEKEVIKEVPYEVKVEVPVHLDRIVKVPTEVPVYIDKVKKVPEPYFIKDPQIVIHERIIPVPENITGEELEKLLDAQPILNRTARAKQASSYPEGEHGEFFVDPNFQPKPKSRDRDREKEFASEC